VTIARFGHHQSKAEWTIGLHASGCLHF